MLYVVTSGLTRSRYLYLIINDTKSRVPCLSITQQASWSTQTTSYSHSFRGKLGNKKQGSKRLVTTIFVFKNLVVLVCFLIGYYYLSTFYVLRDRQQEQKTTTLEGCNIISGIIFALEQFRCNGFCINQNAQTQLTITNCRLLHCIALVVVD